MFVENYLQNFVSLSFVLDIGSKDSVGLEVSGWPKSGYFFSHLRSPEVSLNLIGKKKYATYSETMRS